MISETLPDNVIILDSAIALNLHSKIQERWDAQADKPFGFSELEARLTTGHHTCYLQRRRLDGKSKKDERAYKLTVELAPDCVVCMKMVPKFGMYQYDPYFKFFVPDLQRVHSVPDADAISVVCSFFMVWSDDAGTRFDEPASQLLKKVDELDEPKADIDKEHDKQVWSKYLRGFMALLAQKERAWKIESMRSRRVSEDELLQITVVDDETERLERAVNELFGERDLDALVLDQRGGVATVRFKGERDLTADECKVLQDIGKVNAYELRKEQKKFLKCFIRHKNPAADKTGKLQNQAEQNSYEAIVENVKNTLRGKNYAIDNSSSKDGKTTWLTYEFRDAADRDNFFKEFSRACARFSRTLIWGADGKNELGYTEYVLQKSAKLAKEKEDELNKNLKDEEFAFYSNKENDAYQKMQKQLGADANNVPQGVTIGKLRQVKGRTFTFAVDQKPKQDKEDGKTLLYLLDEKGEKELLKEGGFMRLMLIGDRANIIRMIKAMGKVTDPARYGRPANWNLPNFIFDPADIQEPKSIDEVKEHVLQNLHEERMRQQPKQIEAVAKAIAARDLALIQGPPGTGKTTVIAEIIRQTLHDDPEAKVLVTSQTHLAVDNAIGRLKDTPGIRSLRIGLTERFEQEGQLYSAERINRWKAATVGSKTENDNSENIVCQMMQQMAEHCSRSPEIAEPIAAWRQALQGDNSSGKGAKQLKEDLCTSYQKHVNQFAATCSECGSNGFSATYSAIFGDGEAVFDLVIMDEASKATPPEMLLPLTWGRKVVIIGDHKQLPPMIDSDDFSEALRAAGAEQIAKEMAESEDFKISQFEKLFVNAPDYARTSLDTQFRMHGKIMNCIRQFYAELPEGGLKCGIIATQDEPDLHHPGSRWHGIDCQPLVAPDDHAIWVNVEGVEQHREGESSISNAAEIEAIRKILQVLTRAKGFEQYNNSLSHDDQQIGVITYYSAQRDELKQALAGSPVPLRINTVDKFQGKESNIIIVSTVRSNKAKKGDGNEYKNLSLGFADQPQRINVGLSRARRLLIVVGNKQHFMQKKEYREAIRRMKTIDIKQLENL